MRRKGAIERSIRWLSNSIDPETGGSRANYSWFWNGFKGWSGPYPETTGYIIPTLNTVTNVDGLAHDFSVTTRRMTDWLLSLQFESGAFPGGIHGAQTPAPSVFNTGQIMLGLVDMVRRHKDERCLEAASRAATWLAEGVNTEGYWTEHNYVSGYSPSYYTRVTWPMLEVVDLTSDEFVREAATRATEYIVSRQRKTGFIEGSGFQPEGEAVLHTLAYTLRGFLECGMLSNNEEWVEVARHAANRLMRKREITKRFLGSYNSDFGGTGWYQCLTGIAQMSIVWLRLFELEGDERWVNVACKAIDDVEAKQVKWHVNPALVGGIAGSAPVFGRYLMFRYPNWSVKFFLDAMFLEEQALRAISTGIDHVQEGEVS